MPSVLWHCVSARACHTRAVTVTTPWIKSWRHHLEQAHTALLARSRVKVHTWVHRNSSLVTLEQYFVGMENSGARRKLLFFGKKHSRSLREGTSAPSSEGEIACFCVFPMFLGVSKCFWVFPMFSGCFPEKLGKPSCKQSATPVVKSREGLCTNPTEIPGTISTRELRAARENDR